MLQAKHAITTAWIMVVATATAVGTRIWLRWTRGQRKFHPSDFTIGITGILGVICGSTATSLLDLMLHGPMTPAQQVLHVKLTVVALVNYWVLAWMVKASFLALYWDLKSRLNKELYWVLVFGTVYAAATFIVVLLSNLLWCRPISSMWTVSPSDPNYCFFLNHTTLLIYFVCHMTSDIPLIYMPIRLVRFLKLSRTDMWGMALVAAVAAVSIITAIIRFGILYAAVDNTDKTTFLLKTFVWSCVEETAGQCATCLPAFRAFLRRRHENSVHKSFSMKSVSNVVRSKLNKSEALASRDQNEGYETDLQKLTEDRFVEDHGVMHAERES